MTDRFKKIFLTLLAFFAVSPYIFGAKVFPQKNTLQENIPVLASVKEELPSPTPSFTTPIRIVVPGISIDANIENVGMDEKGRMDVPKNDDDVAWWSLGVKPGEQGNAVLAGHFDRKDGGPAVFYDLNLLKIGDEVEIVGDNGKELVFEVYKKEKFKDSDFPIELVFGSATERNLNLITCDGVFDKNAKNYSDRLVIFTKLKSS